MLKVLTTGELMATPKPPMIVEGLVMEKGLLLFMSYAGTGKTFFALELGVAVATGLPALGKFKVHETGKVLYIGEDSPQWDVREQVKKILNAKDLTIEDLDKEWQVDEDGDVDPKSGPRFLFSVNNGAHLNSEIGLAEIEALVDKFQPKLIIVDTLSSIQDGNLLDYEWAGRVMKKCKRLREKAAVILLHHTTKPKEYEQPGVTGALGSTNIGASLDGALSFKSKAGLVQVRIAKQRAIRLEEFDYTNEWDDDYAKLTVVEQQDEVRDALRVALGVAGPKGMSRKEMLNIVAFTLPKASDSIRQQRWWKAVQRLLSAGEVVKIARGVYKRAGI